MKKRYPLVCLLVVLMTTACSSMHGRPDGKGDAPPFILPELPLPDDTAIARASSRAIQVYVTNNGTEDISVDEEPIYRARNNRDKFVFHLRTAGYAFPSSDAITFPTPPPPGEAIDCRTTTWGKWSYREVRCTNPHNIAGQYKYQMNVLRADGSRLKPLDPFIVNR